MVCVFFFVSGFFVCVLTCVIYELIHIDSCFPLFIGVVFNTLPVPHSPCDVPFSMKTLDLSLVYAAVVFFTVTFYRHPYIYLSCTYSNDLYICVFWSQLKQTRPIHSTNVFTSLNVE